VPYFFKRAVRANSVRIDPDANAHRTMFGREDASLDRHATDRTVVQQIGGSIASWRTQWPESDDQARYYKQPILDTSDPR
jgi:hypothetical protein